MLLDVKTRLRLTYDGMAGAINAHVAQEEDSEDLLGPRTIRRFLEETHNTKPDNISAILMGVAELVIEREDVHEDDRVKCVPLIEMYADLQLRKGRNRQVSAETKLFLESYKKHLPPVQSAEVMKKSVEKAPEKSRENREAENSGVTEQDAYSGGEQYRPLTIERRSKEDRRKDIVKFLAAFSRPSSASSMVERKFFAQHDPDRIYFLTYRFSATPGILQRSFTVLHRPKPDTPIVRFTNFIGEAESPRRSDGLAIGFENEIIFLGHTDFGGSLKVLSFSNAKRPVNCYHGLLLTNDPDDGSLTSRFLMVRTKIANHVDAQTGPVGIADLKLSLEKKWIDRLRNRIRFELEDSIFDAEGNVVEQKDMVALVERRLVEGSKPLLRFVKGSFNPADDRHYTYNSALMRDE